MLQADKKGSKSVTPNHDGFMKSPSISIVLTLQFQGYKKLLPAAIKAILICILCHKKGRESILYEDGLVKFVSKFGFVYSSDPKIQNSELHQRVESELDNGRNGIPFKVIRWA